MQYWCDEKHDDIVYSIFLKKVRYISTLEDSKSHEQCNQSGPDSHLQWETLKERVIKAGSLQKLTEGLIGPDNHMDSKYFNVFFATFRTFASTRQIWSILRALFQRQTDDDETNILYRTLFLLKLINIKMKLKGHLSIVICWIDMFPEDFCERDSVISHVKNGKDMPELQSLSQIVEFSKLNMLTELRHKSKRLFERLKRCIKEGGFSEQMPSISCLSFSITNYDPITAYTSGDEMACSMMNERARNFDTSLENCVQIAEQLTFWDSLLFREIRPYQCLGGIWGRRHKTHPDTYYSVKVTIDQFNALSKRVMTSVLLTVGCQDAFRAKIIEKWIVIAEELRTLRNFSSLKAIISCLQSESVYRLKQTWNCLSKLALSKFKELTMLFNSSKGVKIFSCKAHTMIKDMMSSPATTECPNSEKTKSDVDLPTNSFGTVPYLGSFLTELALLDQAYPDSTSEKRKEFEVLAKIKLFQTASSSYTIAMDQAFCVWFHYLPALDEKECFAYSLKIEPNTPQKSYDVDDSSKSESFENNSPKNSKNNIISSKNTTNSISTNKSFNKASVFCTKDFQDNHLHSSPSGSQFDPSDFTPRSSKEISVLSKFGSIKISKKLSINSISSQNGSLSSPFHKTMFNSLAFTPKGSKTLHSNYESISSSSSRSSFGVNSLIDGGSNGPQIRKNFHLVRVGLDEDIDVGIMYKCIKIAEGDKMQSVIGHAMDKHTIPDGERDNYQLVQILPDGSEVRLPENCNPFYAVAPDPTSPMLNFLLKRLPNEGIKISSNTTKKINKQKRSNLLRWSSGYSF